MQNGFEFTGRVLVTTVLKGVASFLLITYGLLTTAGLRGGGPWQGEAKGFHCNLVYSFYASGIGSNEMLLVTTPHTFVSSQLTFRRGVAISSIFSIRLH